MTTIQIRDLTCTEIKMRCSRCALPDKTPKITFDQNGVCNYCHSYEKIDYQGEPALLEILGSLKKKGKKYDCMVGLSGGRDSTYVLLKLVKDYNMKVLAINYKNPFTVSQAKTNIKNATKRLNVDVVSFNDEKNHHVKFVAAALNAWLKRPSAALIPVICLGCKPAWLKIYKAARNYKIPAIITGGNPFEIISFKRELVGIAREEEAERAFLKYT
jgi:tRNA(Ile)-lysidine synthase TilS/MesJ